MRGGAFFNGKEGRVDFRTTVRKDGLILEKTLCKTIREVEKINIIFMTKVSQVNKYQLACL